MQPSEYDGPHLPSSQAVLDSIPISMHIFGLDGTLLAINRASEQLWGIPRSAAVGNYNLFHDPQATSQGIAEMFVRVAQGETVQLPPTLVDIDAMGFHQSDARQIWLAASYIPILDAAGAAVSVLAVHRDVTEQVARQQEIDAAQQEISRQREELETQRTTIQVLSTPVLQVWEGILTVPIVGTVDEHRATRITEALLEAIVQTQSDSVILDITGVDLIDTQVAHYLVMASEACRLLGCTVVIVGIGSDVAQTIVHLGIDLSEIMTQANLQAGLLWAFERQELIVSRRQHSA